MAALVAYAFNFLDLARLGVVVAEYNTAAVSGLEEGGFTLEGQDREAVYAGGRRWDRLRFGLLRREYRRVTN